MNISTEICARVSSAPRSLYPSFTGRSSSTSRSVPTRRGLSRVDFRASSPTLGMQAPMTIIFPPMCFIARKAPFTAEPRHDSFTLVSLKMTGKESRRFKIDASLSEIWTKMSSGSGRKTSSRSETTNICGWLRFAFRL